VHVAKGGSAQVLRHAADADGTGGGQHANVQIELRRSIPATQILAAVEQIGRAEGYLLVGAQRRPTQILERGADMNAR
jgi:hypothetical protein